MRRLIRWARNLSVSWKLFLSYYTIVIIPVILFGILLYQQTAQSTILQARMLIEENFLLTRANIHQNITIIENISQLIASDNGVRNYLSYHYDNETRRLEDYQFHVAPMIKSIVLQNRDIPRIKIYMDDVIVSESGDSFKSLRKSFDQTQYTAALSSMEQVSGWTDTDEGYTISLGLEGEELVLRFWSTIYSTMSSRNVGVLEVQIREDTLFSMLRDPVITTLGDIFIVNGDGMVISDNIPRFQGRHIHETGIGLELLRDHKINEITSINGEQSIMISIPLDKLGASMIGVFPVQGFNIDIRQSARGMIAVLILSSIILGGVIYLATNALLSRIKKLVRAIKQVNEDNFDVTVPVGPTDEFGELALSFNNMTRRIHDLIETVYKSEIMEKESELKALEAQINPHFLYNTLATISWVARKAKAPEIVTISNALAKFYRLVLNKGNRLIGVREELDMVKAYLEIIQFRVGDRLKVYFEVDDTVNEYVMVKNIIQPIVENALNHGLEPKKGKGSLVIKAKQSNNYLVFQIIDDGVGMDMVRLNQIMAGNLEGTAGSGYAIKNVMNRLISYYGTEHPLEIYSRPGIGTVVTISIEKLTA